MLQIVRLQCKLLRITKYIGKIQKERIKNDTCTIYCCSGEPIDLLFVLGHIANLYLQAKYES